MIKIGFRKFLRRSYDEIEKGLTIDDYEFRIDRQNRCDFLGTDKTGRPVLIECKGIAYPDAVRQIVRYGKKSQFNEPRLMLVAYSFTDECIRESRKHPTLELFECKLKISRLN